MTNKVAIQGEWVQGGEFRPSQPLPMECTLVEYLKHFEPDVFFACECPNETFKRQHRWLAATEAQLGVQPVFRSDGTRIYRVELCGWVMALVGDQLDAPGLVPSDPDD